METRNKALRYSPHLIEHYSGTFPNGELYGPANDKWIAGSQHAWNLAFLSHPYESQAEPDCPSFGRLVFETLGYVNSEGVEVGNLMQQPAPFAVKTILKGAYSGLPLFQIFGRKWVETLEERQWLCQADEAPQEEIEVQSGVKDYLRGLFREGP